MNYFTKEELEDITNSLINNPSRDTLKELNNKYNGTSGETAKELQIENQGAPTIPVTNDIPVFNIPSYQEEQPLSNVETGSPSVPSNEQQTPTFNIPTYNIPQSFAEPTPQTQTTIGVTNEEQMTMPTFNVPSIETNNSQVSSAMPTTNNPVYEEKTPISFNANSLWKPAQNNLMGTTDNFNQNQNGTTNINTTFTSNPFFGNSVEQPNNPIPIGGPQTQTGPSMFGQIMQNNT